VFNEVLEVETRMLAPIAPHVCEELWEMMGKNQFISTSSWPASDEARIDIQAEENEALIMSVLEDTANILKATGATPQRTFYYVAAPWKQKIYLIALKKSVSGKIQQKDLMKELMADPSLKPKAEKTAKFTGQILDEINRMPKERKQRLIRVGTINENQALNEAKDFFKKEIKAEIHIYDEEDTKRYDPRARASLAKPGRPAIFIE
jgi:leucyl-tRNA synthetase